MSDEAVLLGRDGTVVVIEVDGEKTSWAVVANAVLNAEKLCGGFVTVDELFGVVDLETATSTGSIKAMTEKVMG